LAVAGFGIFITLLPLLYVLLRTSQIGYAQLADIIFSARTLELVANSLALTIAVSITSMILGTAQAWLCNRTDLPNKRLFQVAAVLPLAFPSYVLAFSWLAFNPSINGFFGAWLVLSISTAPFVFLAVTAALSRHNSSSEEVARTLGKTQLEVARGITWPAIRPAVLGASLLVALYTLSDFGAVSLMRYDAFTRAIYNAYRASFDRNTAAALALVLILITLVLVGFQRRISQTEVTKSSEQYRHMVTRLGMWRNPAQLLLIVWFSIGVVIPISSISYWIFVGQSSANSGQVLRALLNTLSYGLVGGIVVSLIGLAIAIIVVRYVSRYIVQVEQSVYLTHALPGVVIALAFVFLVNQSVPALYQTSFLVIIAYIALFLPNALAVLKVPISQVPTGVEEVSRTLGSSPMQTIWRVIVPAARPGILSAGAFVALTVIKELPATLILRPTGIETLATRLWSATSVGSFGAGAPYALLLIIVAGIPALLVNREIKSPRNQSSLEPASNETLNQVQPRIDQTLSRAQAGGTSD
jgi:iron(III) transport system permease protein